MRRSQKGFTLLELLVVATMVSVMGAVIFSVFARGLDLRKRADGARIHEKDAWVAADAFAREFRDAYAFPGLPFQGKPTGAAFPTLIRRTSSAELEMGFVEYVYDPAARSILRRQRDYYSLFKDKNDPNTVPDEPARAVLTDVESFTVRYFSFNKSAMKLEWADTWDAKEGFPLGIRTEITLGAAHKGRKVTKTAYVAFPR